MYSIHNFAGYIYWFQN